MPKTSTAGKKKPEELGVKAIDDMTFEVTLNAPTPYFLEMLTHQATYPVSKANVEKFGADFIKPGNLVSNGAYTLAEFVPNDHIKLVKNPKFYDAANVKIDAVNYIPTEDRSTAMKRFEAGELDMQRRHPDRAARRPQGQVRRPGPASGPISAPTTMSFKTDKAPWDNVKLRHAISMAIDRDYLAEKVWQNTMIPAYSMVPPGIAGYETSDHRLCRDVADRPRGRGQEDPRPNSAIGPDKPLKMEIRYNTSENHKNTAVAIQEQLKPLGVEVTLLNTDTKTHYGHLEQKGDFDVARAGWIADYKDPENFLGISCKTGAGNNYAEYTNTEYDDLMDKAAAAGGNPAERMKELSDAEAIGVARDLCVMPLLYYSYHNIVSAKLKGWEENVMDVHPTRFISKE